MKTAEDILRRLVAVREQKEVVAMLRALGDVEQEAEEFLQRQSTRPACDGSGHVDDSAKPAGEPSIPTNARISAIAARHFTNWPKFPDEVFSFARELIESLAAAPAPSPVPDERAAFDEWFCKECDYPATTDTTPIASAYLPWRAWKARSLIAATKPMTMRATIASIEPCPDCHGSGEGVGMEGQGPDTYEVPIVCPKCNGTGAV